MQRDPLEARQIDLDRQRMLTQLPLEPLVVRPHPPVHGEEEVEVVRDRLLRVEERREPEADARVLRRAVVGVDVVVERLRRRGRIDPRDLRQLGRHRSRLVEGGCRPRERRQHPPRQVREACHLGGFQLAAALGRVVASRPLADDDDHVPVAAFVEMQAPPTRPVDDDPDDVLVLSGLREQRVKHAQVRT